MGQDHYIAELETQLGDIEAIRRTLRTLIMWMAQSANSPISVGEAEGLLTMLDNKP